jgi:hypothetical protein
MTTLPAINEPLARTPENIVRVRKALISYISTKTSAELADLILELNNADRTGR